jgi:hypothetical protein
VLALSGLAVRAVGQDAAAPASPSATFVDIGATIYGGHNGELAWGDYDNDGDLDLAIVGSAGGPFARIYRNDGGDSFTEVAMAVAQLEQVNRSAVAWGDFDNDGDLDIALQGTTAFGTWAGRVYPNVGGAFPDTPLGYWGREQGSVAWGDFDSDGALDRLSTGAYESEQVPVVKVDRNEGGGIFRSVAGAVVNVSYSSAVWGDCDGDGDLDIAIAGRTLEDERVSRVYRNEGGNLFVDVGAGLAGVSSGKVTWGDFDNDGDPDLFLAGQTGIGAISRVYRNDGDGVFTDIQAGLVGTVVGSADWGDYDNDGDLDLILVGFDETTQVTKVYRNDGGGVFVDSGLILARVTVSSVAWGDYDNDGDLDIALAGYDGTGFVTKIYRNDGTSPNAPPGAPTGLAAVLGEGSVTLSWSPASDLQTPSSGLMYNVRVSTTPNGLDTLSPMSALDTGWRRLPQMGNAGHRTSKTVRALGLGTYYWSVQAIDTALAGSAFAPEGSFTVTSIPGAETPAIYRSSDRSWYLKNSNSGGAADLVFPYGDPSDQAVKGDWDGDGDDTVGIYRNGTFYIRNSNTAGNADIVIGFGVAGDIPIAGDWDGDGIDTIGIYRPSEAAWFLRNTNTPGPPDLSFTYGLSNETPVAGDWDGDGIDTVGIFRASDRQWYLHNSNAGGNAELVFPYGDPVQDVPVVGDWDGDGDDTVGIYRASLGEWFIRNTNTAGNSDLNFTYGLVNEKPLAGDWDGN